MAFADVFYVIVLRCTAALLFDFITSLPNFKEGSLNTYLPCRPKTEEHLARVEAVTMEIEKTGTYQLTGAELVFATKQAWRNAPRCIGRIQWSNLQVRHCALSGMAAGVSI